MSIADGLDPADKGSGKAMTYADKYALMKAYKIMTGDDPDQYHSNSYSTNNVKPNNIVLDNIMKLLNNDMTLTKKYLDKYNVKNLDELDVAQQQQFNKHIKSSDN